MGLTTASLRPYFATTLTLNAAGYDCGITGNSVSVDVYLFPLSQKASVVKTYGSLPHAIRLGGLGAGAEYWNFGGGVYHLFLTSGSHFVYVYAELLPSTGKLIALAHVIYRGLA